MHLLILAEKQKNLKTKKLYLFVCLLIYLFIYLFNYMIILYNSEGDGSSNNCFQTNNRKLLSFN